MVSRPIGCTWMVVAALFWASCAQVGAPSGGQIDKTPPALVFAQPAMGEVQVTRQDMVLEFDEYVKVRNLNQQLLVSPPLGGPVESIVRGRTVELSWDAPLKENTTYVFQFGDGVVDLNEGNPAESLVRAFSTGAQLDTLKLTGTVVDALDGKPKKGCRAMLYPASWPVDSIEAGAMPLYVAESNAKGEFELGYLPEVAFRCLVVQDDNRNYRWDAGEAVALGPEQVVAGSHIAVPLRLNVTQAPVTAYLSEAIRDSAGFASWTLSEAMTDGDSLRLLDETGGLQMLERRGAQVFAWPWSERCDSVELSFVWHHAPAWPEGTWTTDTLDVPTPRLRRSKLAKLDASPSSTLARDEAISFAWSVPMAMRSREGLLLEVDSIPQEVRVAMDSVSMSMDWRPCEGRWPQGSTLGLTVMPETFVRAGSPSKRWPDDTLSWTVAVHAAESLSEWSLKLAGVQCQGQLEVLDSKNNRMSTHLVKSDTTLVMKGLMPGSYRARWWGDLNGDEVWNGVDVPTWSIPEPVLTMAPVELRANWAVETVWELDSATCASGWPESALNR